MQRQRLRGGLFFVLLLTTTAAGQRPLFLPLNTVAPPRSDTVRTPTPVWSDAEIQLRLAHLYRLYANVLTYRASGNVEQAELFLEQAMEALRQLAKAPGIEQDRRFGEVYRAIVAEYEDYYGPDSLLEQRGDIYALRDALFEAVENNLPADWIETLRIPEEGIWRRSQVPLEINWQVKQHIAYLLRTASRHLEHWLVRMQTYFPMIERIFAEEGVPDELKYLALIESGLNVHARSRAGAVGMWQFIRSTGFLYGLQVDHWVDERRDPEKATRAAARHLRDLYATFGDWHLAIAAYNSGVGNVQRAIQRGGVRNFWAIQPFLPRETRNYVPAYIAAAILCSQPEAFGLRASERGPAFQYDWVQVEAPLPLTILAECAGTDLETLRWLNPELLRGRVPPGRLNYALRIPSGRASAFQQAYAQLPESLKQAMLVHVVQRGETIGRLARQYGVTIRAIREANGLEQTSRLSPGQRLLIPASSSESPFRLASWEVSPATTASAPESAPESQVRHHTVRRGETLSAIARRYGVSIAQLRQWNGLASNRLRVGQRLLIAPPEERSPSASRSSGQLVRYRVQRGDTLLEIARRYGVSVEQLKEWNRLRGNQIRAGQLLRIYRS
ncbi:MAG: LysM peptidoglycan-binding domain-containing protein [Bacteroidota bacterium]|nr:LysM peptidoglycan-binding domain-containing protein [Bacteroidota bacterium]MDW8137281.1 LysM peptidoglycan-binding domain-containing protein [Bacteroidota bacterium]